MDPMLGQEFSGNRRKASGAVRRARSVYAPTPWGLIRVTKGALLRTLRGPDSDKGEYYWRCYADGNLHICTGPWSLFLLTPQIPGCATPLDPTTTEADESE